MTAEIIEFRRPRSPMTARRRSRRSKNKPMEERAAVKARRAERRNTFYSKVGERLRVCRELFGISEQEAASAFYVTLRTYRRWEKGGVQSGTNYRGLVNFCDTFNVLPEWLLGGPKHGSPPRFKPRLVN
jgi:hypothetical protein